MQKSVGQPSLASLEKKFAIVIPFVKINVMAECDDGRICPSPLVTNTKIGSHLNINNGTNDLSDLSHTGRHSSGVAKGAGTAFERVGEWCAQII